MADTVGYHRSYRLSDDNVLVEDEPGARPRAGSIARDLATLRTRQTDLNARLAAFAFAPDLRDTPPQQAGIYPLKVTHFTCTCEHGDADGMCEQLTERLGNLRVITEVPFMRKGNVLFAIRSQGLVDPATGQAESVDALFGGGIYWEGTLDEARYDYYLNMFRSGKDQCVGRMAESIDLTRRLSEIDPAVYQAEVAYHLEKESSDAQGRATLGRNLADYASPRELAQVEQCYLAAAAFGAAAAAEDDDVPKLAKTAREACQAVPGKRYYQAYEAFLRGMGYDPS